VREADYLPPSSFEVKKSWGYSFTFPLGFHGVALLKHRVNFTFTFLMLLLYVLMAFSHIYSLSYDGSEVFSVTNICT